MGSKFHRMDRFPGYTINAEGEVKDPDDNLLKPFVECENLYYRINNIGYSAARLVWETFIGEINTYIRYADNDIFNIGTKNLKVDIDFEIIPRKNAVDPTEYRINDIRYRNIPGYSKYLISKKGTVFSLERNKFITKSFNHAGYPTVTLVDDTGFRAPRKVHRLVYRAYIGELDPSLIIDHIDTNILNSEWLNLRQISTRENVFRVFKLAETHGDLIRDSAYDIGESITYSTDEIYKICEMLSANKSHEEILDAIGHVNTSTEYNSLVEFTTNLRARTIYKNVADQFKVPSKPRFKSKERVSVFSPGDIKFIVDQFKLGRTQRELAALFNVSQPMISFIIGENLNVNVIDVAGSTTIESIAM